MFQKFIENFNEFASHHQTLIAGLLTLSFICVSWGIEKILDEFLLPHKPFYGYIAIIASGLFTLWLIKYIVLQAS